METYRNRIKANEPEPMTQKQLKDLRKLLDKYSLQLKREEGLGGMTVEMVRRWVDSEIED